MMMYLLTPAQAEAIRNRAFAKDSYFNPIQDADGNWVISVEEVNQCTAFAYRFVKKLPTIPWNPPPVNLKALGLE